MMLRLCFPPHQLSPDCKVRKSSLYALMQSASDPALTPAPGKRLADSGLRPDLHKPPTPKAKRDPKAKRTSKAKRTPKAKRSPNAKR